MPEGIIWATNEDGSIEYVQVTKDMLLKSLEVMHKSFYINENVCVALGLPEHPESFPEMDVIAKWAADDGISIAAIDRASGKIAGVSFNKLQDPYHCDFYLKHLNWCQTAEVKKVTQWMLDMDKTVDIFEHCKTKRAMEIMFVGILPEFRKRGIAKKLFEVSIDVAKRLHLGENLRIPMEEKKMEITRPPEIVVAVCTTVVIQKIAKNLGFETAARVDFDKFIYDGVSLGSRISSNTPDVTYEYLRL